MPRRRMLFLSHRARGFVRRARIFKARFWPETAGPRFE